VAAEARRSSGAGWTKAMRREMGEKRVRFGLKGDLGAYPRYTWLYGSHGVGAMIYGTYPLPCRRHGTINTTAMSET
jgi:hypothetical protein